MGVLWGESPGFFDAAFAGATDVVFDDRSLGPQQVIFPVTKDFTQFARTSTSLQGPSLRDTVEGETWRLNRLVGQLHVDVSETNTTVDNHPWPCLEVAAGFFVARASDNDPSLPDLTFDEIDCLNGNNIQNSWIWRRSWILSRPLASNVGFSAIPCSNSNMAVGSGPFFDSTVKRNIRREHRLWFTLGCIGWDGNALVKVPGALTEPYLRYNLDVRIHGIMKRGKESPTF